jgi:hypothetical protein
MKPIFKITTMFFIIISILALIFIKGEYGATKIFDIGYGSTESSEVINFEIGDEYFFIPKNYIWSKDSWRGGKMDGVNMHALLPNFDPYTGANKNYFDSPGWGRKISMRLFEYNMQNSKTSSNSKRRIDLFNVKTKDYFDKKSTITKEENAPYGLKKLVRRTDVESGYELYIGHKYNGDFYWVECDRDGLYPSPSCSTYLEISPHTAVEYTFSKDFLHSWRSVDDSVFELIQKFSKKKGAK